MTWHLIEGVDGCAFARENDCVAIVVDALRASATAAMLLHAGAIEVTVVREVEDAFEAKSACPEALLYGERGGLPPEGFDHGNSPLDVGSVAGKPVIFTTTTGAGRVIDSYGSRAVYMGTTVNALGVAIKAASHDADVVLIPAGLADDPEFEADEDWAAAVSIALMADAEIGEGALYFREWRQRLELDGLPKLFEMAPHAEKLRAVNLHDDIAYCAKLNLTDAVPQGVERTAHGVILRRA